MHIITLTLAYKGSEADGHALNFYDASRALMGFERSLALTTHLILNSEIITQAPSLRGASIYALPPKAGSWEISAAIVIGGALFAIGTAPTNTPLGHLVHSVYDYMISRSLGFHVDYGKSLGQLREEHRRRNTGCEVPEQHQLESLAEKCSPALSDLHRPIVVSHSAESGRLHSNLGKGVIPFRAVLNEDTYGRLQGNYLEDTPCIIQGCISSFNSNTYKGRIYVNQEGRPVSFDVAPSAKNRKTTALIVDSLRDNAKSEHDGYAGVLYCKAFRIRNRAGTLKGYLIVEVSKKPISAM